MSLITTSFSGIVINQNAALATTSSATVIQSFTLPSDYERGGQIIPDLTGFHVFANATNVAASLTWTFDVQIGGVWTTLASGTTTGVAHTGQTWFEVLFEDSVPVTSSMLSYTYRINITAMVDMTLGYSAGTALMYRVLAAVADSGTDFLGNLYRSAVLESSIENVDTYQATDALASWISNPSPSRFGVEALYMDIRSPVGAASVIDRITLDPMTPGVWFHVYWSNDPTGPGTNTASWENLLWTPIYQTYQLNRMQTFALPEPITAKYLCIEFTNLQTRSYNPGNFQLPATYKKYPQWVLNYFVNLFLQQGVDRLSSSVNVVYDALDLAYTYYQGDLLSQPDPPISSVVPNSQQAPFLQPLPTTLVDGTSLRKVSLDFQPYLTQPALRGGGSAISQYAASTAADDYSTEVINTAIANTAYVSNLQRDALLIEKGFPAMYFFLQCRHAFRVAQAVFDTNVAYFAGIRQLVLHRDVYTSYADQAQYNENLGDGANLAINDWQTL